MLNVKFMSPDKILYKGPAHHIVARSTEGEFAIYTDHINIITTLAISGLKIVDENNNEHIFTVSGGYLYLEDNKLTILTKAAENLENIDVQLALTKKEKLEKLIENSSGDDLKVLELKLKKQMNRITQAKEK